MIKLLPITLFFFLFQFENLMFAQTAELLMDINPGSDGSFVFNNRMILEHEDVLYFTAKDAEHGSELWAYDGSQVYMVKDIRPGVEGSDVENMYLLNGKMIFTANDGVHGSELWTSDGTVEGTQLVIDLGPGSVNGASTCCSNEEFESFVVYKNEFYFNGSTTNMNRRLYKTDGTEAGTVFVKELNHPQRSAAGYTIFNDELYFRVIFEGFWKTDGTTEGTVLIKERDEVDNIDFDPLYMTDMGDYMLMMNGIDKDLWRSDGTTAGTVKLKDFVNPLTQNNQGEYIVRYGDIAIFAAADMPNDAEMWRSDGTANGTRLIKNIQEDMSTSARGPKRRILFENLVYFITGSLEHDFQLYKTDGTEAGTDIVVNLDDQVGGEIYFQTDLVTNGEYIFFVGGRAFDRELWYTDGNHGAAEIVIHPSGESTPERLRFYKDKLFMYANGDGVGYEPHIVELSELTPTTELDGEVVSVYPVPADDRIYIDGIESLDVRALIYDMNGRLVHKADATQEMEVSNLVAGSYILKLINDKTKSSATTKLIIAR